jgi:hypothetical protein
MEKMQWAYLGKVPRLITKMDAQGRTLLVNAKGKTRGILEIDAQERTVLTDATGKAVLISENDDQGRTLVMNAQGKVVRISEDDERGRALLMNKRGKTLRISENDAQERTLLRNKQENILMIANNDARGKIRRVGDWYFAPKYMIPISKSTADWGSVHAEVGRIFSGNFFEGYEFSYSYKSFGYFGNFGGIYDMNNDLQLMYGGTFGVFGKTEGATGIFDEKDESIISIGFGAGPFIRLQWNFIEFSYRGFMMAYGENTPSFRYDNQLSIGLYFATSNRKR